MTSTSRGGPCCGDLGQSRCSASAWAESFQLAAAQSDGGDEPAAARAVGAVGLADKAYISADQAADLWQHNRTRLLTLPRCNQPQLPATLTRLHNSVRQIIKTVNGQLTGQFHIETNHAHSFWGLCTRLYAKLTAHTLCIYINRLLAKPDFLQIRALASPI